MTRINPNRIAFLLLSTLIGVAAFFVLPRLVVHAGQPMGTPMEVETPWVTSADHEVGGAVFNHAAGLAFGDGSEVALGFTLSVGGEQSGDGLYGSASSSLGPLHVGVGLSRIAGVSDAVIRTDVGLALALGSQASIGLGWSGLAAESGALDGFSSWSLSATVRPSSFLSLGFDLDGLNTPVVGDVARPVAGRLGVAIRPGTNRFTFDFTGGMEFTDNPQWSAGGGMRTMLVDGVSVGFFGRYDTQRGGDDRLQWGVHLALDQGRLGTGFSVFGTPSSEGGEDAYRLSTMLSYSGKGRTSLVKRRDQVVVLEIGGKIPEQPQQGLFSRSSPAFADWLAALWTMADDETVSGVLLRIKASPNWSQCWEMRSALQRIQRNGKKVYAALQVADMRTMYLASMADKVFLDPAGALMLTGLSVTQTYVAGAMEKLGIRAQFIAFDEHKTYPERFLRTAPSPLAKEQTQKLLNHFMETWLESVSVGRGIDPDTLRKLLHEGPLTMKDALSKKLVDALVDASALRRVIEEDIGRPVRLSKGYHTQPRGWKDWGQRQRIAIIPIVGAIGGGKSRPGFAPLQGPSVGSESIVKVLRHVEENSTYAGAVIRIESPGGGVVASDVIQRAVKRLAKRKPVIVSFANVAASGGYYVALGARTLMASPTTITGSIGIFAGKADLQQLYAKIGLSTDSTLSNEGADLLSMYRPWTEQEMSKIRTRLAVYYDRFLDLFASGRGLTIPEARERAGGRVVDGARAKALGMIDDHGSLWDALRSVAKQAGLDHVAYTYLPKPSGLTTLLRSVGLAEVLGTPPTSSFTAFLKPIQAALTGVFSAQQERVMMRMPMQLEVL